MEDEEVEEVEDEDEDEDEGQEDDLRPHWAARKPHRAGTRTLLLKKAPHGMVDGDQPLTNFALRRELAGLITKKKNQSAMVTGLEVYTGLRLKGRWCAPALHDCRSAPAACVHPHCPPNILQLPAWLLAASVRSCNRS